MISTGQIRAARALLDWTQGQLAQRSGLSLRALNSIERGLAVPRIDNLRAIQETLEREGIEFTPNDGVHRWMKPEAFNHIFYIVYGDNVAFQILGKPHRVIIIRNPGIADMFRRQFDFNWATAETPWFAKRFKIEKPDEPWSVAKAAAAREWIEKEGSRG